MKWLAIACVLASGCSSPPRPRCPGLAVHVAADHVRVVNTSARTYTDVTVFVGSEVGRFRATLDMVEPRSNYDVTDTLRDGADRPWRPLMRATTVDIEAGCR